MCAVSRSFSLPCPCLSLCCLYLSRPGKGSHDRPYRKQHGPVSGLRGTGRGRYQKGRQVSERSAEGEHRSPSPPSSPLLAPGVPTCVLGPMPPLSSLASSKHLCRSFLETSCPSFPGVPCMDLAHVLSTQEPTLEGSSVGWVYCPDIATHLLHRAHDPFRCYTRPFCLQKPSHHRLPRQEPEPCPSPALFSFSVP